MGWRESGIAILASKNKLSDQTKKKSNSYAKWIADERSGAHADSYVNTSDPEYEEFSWRMLNTPSSARASRLELSRQARENLSDGITPLWKRQAAAPASFTEELRRMYGRPSGIDYGRNPYNAEWKSYPVQREKPQARFRPVTDSMKSRFAQSEEEWNNSGFAGLGRTETAIRFAKMSAKDREKLSPSIRARVEEIYRDESKAAEDYARQTGSSGRADAYFNSFANSYGLGVPSLLARKFGNETVKQNTLYNELNALNHSVSSGAGNVTGWMMPGGLNNAVAKGTEKVLKPVANAAEKGVIKTIAKATGKDAVGLALSKPAAIAARSAQRAASSALTGFGAGVATGAIESAASGNEAGQVARDALRQGRDFAVGGAIGGGIGGAIEGSRLNRTMSDFAEQYMKAGGDETWGNINNWYRGVKPSSGVPVATAGQTFDKAAQTTQASSALPGVVNNTAANVRNDLIKPTAESAPIRAGQATTIKNPYTGLKPVQANTENLSMVQIPDTSVNTAQKVVGMARDMEGGKIKRTDVRKAYEQIFEQKGGQKQVPVKGMTMDGQPYVVDVNRKAIGKVISDPNLSIEKLAVLNNIEDIITNGMYVGSGNYEQKGKKEKYTKRFDYFETPVTIGGQEYISAFDVEVFPNVNNYRTHKVIDKMDLIATNSADVGPVPTAPEGVSSPYDNTIPQKGDIVKDSIPQTGNKNVQADQYASEPERWTAQNKNETAIVSSIPEIVDYIKKNFEIPISTGNIETNTARGIFKVRPEAIRIKVANALPTISHELGHYIDKKFNLSGSDNIIEAIQAMDPAFASKYEPDEIRGEAIAEFMRTYLSDKTVAQKQYPTFYNEFVERIDSSTMKKLDTLADMVNGYLSGDMDTAMASAITSRTTKNKTAISERLTNMYNSYMDHIIDDLYPLQQLEKEAERKLGKANEDMRPYLKAMNARRSAVIVKYAVEDGLVNSRGEKVYDSLGDILSAIDGDKYDSFNQYMTARHAAEWLTPDESGKTKRVFADDRINDAEYQRALADRMESENPEFKDTSERIYEFQRTLMKTWLVDTGLMSSDMYESLMQKYPHYVPFYRAVNRNVVGTKRGYANQSNPLKRAKGSGEAIYNPVENIVVNVDKYINAAKRNGVMQSVVNIADNIEGMGAYIEEVPPDKMPYSVDLRGKKKMLSDIFGNDGKIDEIFDTILSDFETGFKPYTNGGKNIVTVMQNGEKRYFQVHNKRLYDALTSITPDQLSPVAKVFETLSSKFKALTTGANVFFSGSNLPRDIQTGYVNTKAGTTNYMKNLLLSAVDIIRNSDDYKLYKAVGGGYNTPLSANKTEFKRLIRDISNTKPKLTEKIAKVVRHPIEMIEDFSNVIETAPRLAEFKATQKRGSTLDESLFESNDITVNFARHGRTTRKLEPFIPYTNAAVQGIDKNIRAIKDNPAKVLLKMVSLIVPTLVGYASILSNGEEGKKAYSRLSSYKKNNFYNIYIGGGKFISIAKARDTNTFANLIERGIESLVEGTNEFDGFWDYLANAYIPFDGLSSMFALGNAYDLARNKDFAGRPIVPTSMQKLEAKDQHDENTTWIAKQAGRLGLSPKQTDYLINSNLGFIGRINKAVGAEKKDPSLGLKNQFITDSVYSTDILNNFYDSKERNDKAYNSGKLLRREKDEVVEKYMQDTAVSSVLSTYNKFIKAESDINKKRDLKEKQMEVIEDGKYIQNFPEVMELYRSTGENAFPFNNMDIEYEYSQKNSSGKIVKKIPVSLTPEQYTKCLDDMNKEIIDEYEKVIGNGYNYGKKRAKTDEEKVKMLKDIKSDIKSKYKEKYGKEAKK